MACYVVERICAHVDAYIACRRKEETPNSKENNKTEEVFTMAKACTSVPLCMCLYKETCLIYMACDAYRAH